MQANWSLILNVLLLLVVMVAIVSLIKARRQSLSKEPLQPALGITPNSPYDAQPFKDDIIAVRKVNKETENSKQLYSEPLLVSKTPNPPTIQPKLVDEEAVESLNSRTCAPTLMVFLLAKDNKQFAGYELLQTLLAAGLRFGEGQLFHRHQSINGQGPVFCSLAAATANGVFDLQNIGAFSVKGLCLFMHTSKNSHIDAERFSVLLDTAKQLSEGLDAYLLDDRKKPLTKERIEQYKEALLGEETV